MFAQSFMTINEKEVYVNITEGIPNLQCWCSDTTHYTYLPIEINTLKNIQCDHLGDRLNAKDGGVLYDQIHGLMPLKEEYSDVFDDIVINGKMIFYEKGLIFQDNKLHATVLPFTHIAEINIYNSQDWWLEILTQECESSGLKTADLFPHSLICQQRIYLKVDRKFYEEKFEALRNEFMIDKYEGTSRANKKDTECPLVHKSQTLKNFELNQRFNKQFSTEFMSRQFNLKLQEEYMEFVALQEFNHVKGKEFISFAAFAKVSREADQEASMPDSKTNDLIKKLMQGTEAKTSVIIVSGVPGSGKGRTADFLARQFAKEGMEAAPFKMETVQDCLKYNTEKFIK